MIHPPGFGEKPKGHYHDRPFPGCKGTLRTSARAVRDQRRKDAHCFGMHYILSYENVANRVTERWSTDAASHSSHVVMVQRAVGH